MTRKDEFKKVGQVLKNLRNENNLTLKEASKKVGISLYTLERYEKNYSKIPLDNLLNILKVYKIKPEYFFTECFEKLQKENG